jgi:hypothetical protein
MIPLRDRPFNLKGGGYGFLFHSEYFFWTTQELEFFFFLSRKVRNFPDGVSHEGKYCTKFLNQYSFKCSKFYKLYK